MLKYCDKPLIFPLSNPSSKAEITAEKAYEYAHGKCVYASGMTPRLLASIKPARYTDVRTASCLHAVIMCDCTRHSSPVLVSRLMRGDLLSFSNILRKMRFTRPSA